MAASASCLHKTIAISYDALTDYKWDLLSRVFIVGAPNARAVLCTEDKSYFIKKEDTSNLRLLTSHTNWSRPEPTTTKRTTIQVSGAARFHYLVGFLALCGAFINA